MRSIRKHFPLYVEESWHFKPLYMRILSFWELATCWAFGVCRIGKMPLLRAISLITAAFVRRAYWAFAQYVHEQIDQLPSNLRTFELQQKS
jgi:hypothetical protein